MFSETFNQEKKIFFFSFVSFHNSQTLRTQHAINEISVRNKFFTLNLTNGISYNEIL